MEDIVEYGSDSDKNGDDGVKSLEGLKEVMGRGLKKLEIGLVGFNKRNWDNNWVWKCIVQEGVFVKKGRNKDWYLYWK